MQENNSLKYFKLQQCGRLSRLRCYFYRSEWVELLLCGFK